MSTLTFDNSYIKERNSRSSSSFQEKYQEIYNKITGDSYSARYIQKEDNNGRQTDHQTSRSQLDTIQKQQNISGRYYYQNQDTSLMENSRQINPIRQYLEGDHIISGNLNSNRKDIQDIPAYLNQSSHTPNDNNQDQKQILKETNIKNIKQDYGYVGIQTYSNKQIDVKNNKLNENKENINVINYKNEKIDELIKQNTQLKITNEKLQRKILEKEYEIGRMQEQSSNIDNIQFKERLIEEKQISIRKSELEIEELTKQLQRETQMVLKQKQALQQEFLVHKKQLEIQKKEQERLNEEAKKLKLWEEKIQEQERALKERIIKFENRDELLNERENALKRHENQLEQKRVFALQIIERLGQHDEQLYSYSKSCEQRCEKIDQFQNLLYNQITQHEDLDLRMEGLKLNESIFQKKIDLEMNSYITQAQKLKEKESDLIQREKNISLQNEKRQLKEQKLQQEQKLAKSLDKPIAINEYNNMKSQCGSTSRIKPNTKQPTNLSSQNLSQTYQNSICVDGNTSLTSTMSQLQFKNKNQTQQQKSNIIQKQTSQTGNSFKRINSSQQNYSLQIQGNQSYSEIENQENQRGNNNQNNNISNNNTNLNNTNVSNNKNNSNYNNNAKQQKKRRSESHQTLSHSNSILNSYQNDGQTTLLSFDNNLDLTVMHNQNTQNQIIKLNQFASQEDLSEVINPNNLPNNGGILMTSYHLDDEIGYFYQDVQKEGDQIRQISIMASPQQHCSEQAKQQQTLQDQYQTFQKEHLSEDHNIINVKNGQQKSNPTQFLSIPCTQQSNRKVFSHQFDGCQIAKEIIQDDNLLSNRDYFNSDELDLLSHNKANQPIQHFHPEFKTHPNNVHASLQELSQIAKLDTYQSNNISNHYDQILD